MVVIKGINAGANIGNELKSPAMGAIKPKGINDIIGEPNIPPPING
jgi:hypothetical protein